MVDKELGYWIIKNAKSFGADEVSLVIVKNIQSSVEVRKGEVELMDSSEELGLTLSLYIDEKYSVNRTSLLAKESLKDFIKNTVEITKRLNKDKYRKLPSKSLYWNGTEHSLEIMDDEFFNVKPETKKEMVIELEKNTSSLNDKIVSVNSSYSDSYSEILKMNSNGFIGKHKASSFSMGSEVVVRGDNGSLPSDWYYSYTRYFEDIQNPNVIAADSVKLALEKIGQRKVKSGNYNMIVSNRVSAKLIGLIISAVKGNKIWNKSSFLDGKLGKKVFSRKLTIYDVPHLKRGLGTKEFDGDGFATVKRNIVDKGVLKYYLLNNYFAEKLKMKPTTGSTTNILLNKGNTSLEEMIKFSNKGIFVKSFLGGNVNSSTGDFSFGINGKLIENGELTLPVNEMNITGNVIDLFNRLVEIGNDPYPYSSYRTPSLLFENISFNGI